MTSEARLPPHSKPAEMAVLGAILLEAGILSQVSPILSAPDFYIPAHQDLFDAMIALDDRRQPIDLTTLSAELDARDRLNRIGGVEYIVELASQVPTTANAMHYAMIVRDKSRVRRLIGACHDISSKAYAPKDEDEGDEVNLFDWAGQVFYNATLEDRVATFSHIKTELVKFLDKMSNAWQNPEIGLGVPSGFDDLDRITGGFKRGDLVILAARPSMGKTALALNMAESAARSGVPTLVFSLEMNAEQLTMRLLSSASRVNLHQLRNQLTYTSSKTSDASLLHRITGGCNELFKAPLVMDDTPGISMHTVRARARQWRSNRDFFPAGEPHKRGLILIDYLQLMHGRTGKNINREQEISEISRGLKALARELDLPVIVLSQLNREVEKEKDKKPMLSHLRESGAIEQDADIIMFIHRAEYYDRENPALKGKAELIVAKHRNGPTGTVNLQFIHECTKFENATTEDNAAIYVPPEDSPF